MSFLFLLFVQETNVVFETLTPSEIKQINELPEGEGRYALNCIKNGTLPVRRDWSNLNKGEMFFGPTAIKVNQIVDGKSFIGYGQSVWVEGVNTSGLADDDNLRTNTSLFLCVGNKQYTTVLGGTKTVMKVEVVDTDAPLKLLRAIAKPRGYRVWGEGSERIIMAKYLRSSRRTVLVELLNGKRESIPRKALTPVDSEWVDEQEKAKRSAD